VVSLESLRLVGDDTDLSSTGTMQLVDGQDLKLRADGQLNLKLLQSFDPEIVAYGKTSIADRIRKAYSTACSNGNSAGGWFAYGATTN